MASRDTSVNLVIRARNEADRAINTVTKAVDNLLNTTEQGGNKVALLTKALLEVDKAAGTIAAGADRGEAAFNKLGAQVAARRADFESLKNEAKAAAETIRNLNSGDAIVNAGRNQSGRLAQLKAAEDGYRALQAQIERLGATIASDEARLNGSRSALQQLSSTAIAAANAQTLLRAEVELETQALARQAVEAERVTAIQARINALTGVNRPATFDGNQARQSAEILAEAAARDELIQKYRQQAAEARDLAAAEAAEAANRRRFNITEDPRGNQARVSAAVFEQQARATNEVAASEQRLRAELNPGAAIRRQYNDRIRDAIALYRNEKISVTELTAAIKLYRNEATRAQVDLKRNGGRGAGIFGLRPYEVTNLGYQINDLVTQVASGTSVFQALAQQGGQILQLLPQIGTRLIALATNPFFIAGAAAVGTLVVGFKELADQSARLRSFESALTAIGNGTDYTAAGLEKVVDATRRYGVAGADAAAALKEFVNQGIAPERLTAFTKTAQDMADVLGVKVPEAAKQLADSFTGGYDAIVKLDEATNFLTTAQREQIRTLFEEGRAQEARAEAYRIFASQQQDAAEKARGPWSEAVRQLGIAWREFTNFLANNSVIQAMGRAVANLARTVTQLLRALNGGEDAVQVFEQIRSKQEEIARLQAKIAAEPAKNLYRIQLNDAQRGLETLKRQYEQATGKSFEAAAAADRAAGGSGGGDTVSDGADTPAAKRRSDRLAEIERERERDRLKNASDVERIRIAGQQAYDKAIKATGDTIIANAERALAIDRERAKVNEENAREAERRVREGQTSLGASRNLLIEREGFRSRAYYDRNAYRVGYGSDTVTNPDGTISRVTRNTTTTVDRALVDLERRIKEFQDVIKRQIGADRFGAFNPQQQASLTSVAYNYGSLPQRIIDDVKNGTAEQIAAAIRSLGSDNGGINRGRRNREAALFTAAPNTELDAYNEQQAQKRQEAQDKFNQSLDDEITKRREAADALRIEGDLTGDKLLDARKAREISNAINDERRKAREAGIAEDDAAFQARLKRLAEELDREFELRNQKQRQQNRIDEVQKPVDSLVAQRSSLQAQLEAAQRGGQTNLTGRLSEEIQSVNQQLAEAIEKAIAFYQALSGPDADRAIATLRGINLTVDDLGKKFLLTGAQINEAIAGGVANAFDRFAKDVAEGRNVIDSLRDAFLQFAADFLRQIAQMIIQQAIFNAIGGASGGGGGGVGGGIGGIIGKLFHSGGIVGYGGGTTRQVNPAWFNNALRYHSGGIAGLAADEVPAVLRRGEEVLTRADPRHRANGGGSSGGGGSVKVVNVFDSAAAIEEALNSPAGEQAVLNHVRNNPAAWKSALGS